MISRLVPHPLYLPHDLRAERTSIPPEIVRRPYSRLSLYPSRVQRISRLPVYVVAHHRKAQRQLLSLEVLSQRQNGVVLRDCGTERAEF